MGDVRSAEYCEMRERFVAARQAVERAEHHKRRIPEIRSDIQVEHERNRRLRIVLETEDRDVEEIARISRKFDKVKWNWLRHRTGERLERAELEAKAAADAVIASNERIAELQREANRLEGELVGAATAGQDSEVLRFELETLVRRSFPSAAQELRELDERTATVHQEIVEVEEAIAAAEFALIEMDEVVTLLANAKKWSNIDVFFGGMLVSAYKQDKVRVSSAKAREANLALEILNKELGDTGLQNVEIRLDQVTRFGFSDIFFDSFLMDVHIDGQISTASEGAVRVRDEVRTVLDELNTARSEANQRIVQVADERNEILSGLQ